MVRIDGVPVTWLPGGGCDAVVIAPAIDRYAGPVSGLA
jgi:hypothetical protein